MTLIKEVSLFCVDGLTGFREAIGAVNPEARIQRCIIYLVCNITKFASYKHLKKFMKNLKMIYQATTEEQTLNQLSVFKDNWEKFYPTAIRSWEENWNILSTCKLGILLV